MNWQLFDVDGVPALAGVHDGRAWAIEDRCSHAACSFSADGEVVDGVAICNCHGSEFDVFTGEVLRPPARLPVRTFAVSFVDGVFEVGQ